jgi:ArsR family transcriptional regulator, virulence genes transcriptional regulator
MLMDDETLEAKATAIAHILKSMANPRRLMVLCKLMVLGSATVNELAKSVGLSQSALSQHLSLMRDEGLVTFDRAGQTLHYRIADPRVLRHLTTLYDLYCAPPQDQTQGPVA